MQVQYLLVARYSERAADGSLNLVGAGFDFIWTPFLPHLAALYVAAKVSFDRSEVKTDHALHVKLLDPDGELILETNKQPVPPCDLEPDCEFYNVQLSMGFGGLPLFKEGRYYFELFVDDEMVKRTPFRVQKVSQPAGENQPVAETAEAKIG